MRILHLAKYYWPHSGGMERVVQDLAEGAATLGHEVEVVAYESGGKRDGRRSRSHVTRVFSLGAVGAQEIAPGYLTAARRRADIVHLHHPHTLADFASLSRSRKAPLVITQHDDTHRRGFRRMLARAALARAAAIVVPSRAHVAMSTELVGHESKVEVIPFGVDIERWITVPVPPPGPPKAIFIGRLVRYKGVDILLRALERVPDLSLDIVGSGPESSRLKTLARALAITDRIRWFGEYPDEDLTRRMAEAHFLVLPSVTVEEMFGLVVIEAMAASRPVITTALPSGVREVNVAGETGLEVPLRDVDALADALDNLAHNTGLRARMGEAGRLRAERFFSRRRMVNEHLGLYERLVRESVG
ncbi:MAG: glycosyltransferase [Gemmatimonadota bacterium]